MKEILKELRIKHRLSQELLAKLLGLSRQAYMKYESGEVEPSVEIVRKLTKIYRVPYDMLIDNRYEDISRLSTNTLSQNSQSDYLSVASPSTALFPSPTNVNSINNNKGLDHFSQVLSQMQEMIMSLQNELDLLKDMQKKTYYSKSKKFDRDNFFKKIGNVKMDSSYINELREESLI